MRAWLSHPAARIVAGLVATAAILVPLSAMWVRSLVPATYSVMDMGYADYGGGPRGGHTHHAAGAGVAHAAAASSSHAAGEVSVASLTGPQGGTPDVVATLVAREETFKLRSGEPVSGYTLNHSSPGPLLRARQGDLVQVTLVNANVSDGVTLHWHGIDVPNAEDGVAGVTQDADAVLVAGQHVAEGHSGQPMVASEPVELAPLRGERAGVALAQLG